MKQNPMILCQNCRYFEKIESKFPTSGYCHLRHTPMHKMRHYEYAQSSKRCIDQRQNTSFHAGNDPVNSDQPRTATVTAANSCYPAPKEQ